MFEGQVVAIYVAPEPGAPMEGRDAIEALAGVGLAGDRYAQQDGTYSRADDAGKRAVTLIEREAIEGARHEYDLELGEHETRRNVVTEGLPLNHLVGRAFRIG